METDLGEVYPGWPVWQILTNLRQRNSSEEEYLPVSGALYLSLLMTEETMLKLDHLLYSFFFLVIVLNSLSWRSCLVTISNRGCVEEVEEEA